MLITVFTPCHNRETLLPRLYESLCRQTFRDFEWVAVDDGSTDGTYALLESFSKTAEFPTKVIRTDNGGKHRAINRGVQVAKGELFFIVDSDDYLPDDSLSVISAQYSSIRDDSRFCGVCGMKHFADGTRIGGVFPFDTIDCSSLDLRYTYGIKGDLAEVLRTDVIRKFPFPEFDGEKFCPEALVFERIAEDYIFRYFNSNVYICEYQPDGLSAGIHRTLRRNPRSTRMYYRESLRRRIPFKYRIKALLNLIRYSI